MKRGPFPMRPAFPTSEYYDPLRLPLDHPSHFPGSPVIGQASLPAARRRRGRDGSPGFPRRPSARSTPNTPEGSSAPAPGTRALSMAFAVLEPARHPLFPARRRARLTTLTQASLTLQTARSLRPASHPTSRSRTGASLPGTQASPRTGLTPAGHRELIAPTSCDPPFPHDAGAVPAHASTRAAANPPAVALPVSDKGGDRIRDEGHRSNWWKPAADGRPRGRCSAASAPPA